MPVGSIAYSDGITTVMSNVRATMAAIRVDCISFSEEGSSARVGKSVLYIIHSLSGKDIATKLVAHQQETGAHHHNVSGVGMTEKARGLTPVTHHDQNGAESQ